MQITDRQGGRYKPEVIVAEYQRKVHSLLEHVRPPTSEEARILGKRGIIFLPVSTRSLADLVRLHPAHFRGSQLPDLDKIPEVRDYTLPRPIEVGLQARLYEGASTAPLHLEKSNMYPRVAKILENDELSRTDEDFADLPDARAIIAPAVVYAAADLAYAQQDKEGRGLLRGLHAEVLEDATDTYLPSVGRYLNDHSLSIGGSNRSYAPDGAFAIPAVVFVDRVTRRLRR